MHSSSERALPGGGWPRFLSEFVQGAVRPSFAAAAGAIVVAGLLILISCIVVTEQRVGRMNPGYLMASPADEYARLTIDTLRVAHGPPEPLSVVIVGDSSLREAITSEEDLRQRIKLKSGQDAVVHVLAAGGLTHWESAAIVDRLSKRTRGIIITGISPYQLALPVTRLNGLARLGFNSPAFKREMRMVKIKPPPDAHAYFLNQAGFFLVRPAAIHNLIHGPLRDAPIDHASDAKQWTPKLWRMRRRQIYSWVKPYKAAHKRNLGVYQRMAQRTRQIHGLQLALLNSLTNPLVRSPAQHHPPGFDRAEQGYSADVKRFAARNRLPYWDIAAEAQLTADDFVDYTHIRRQSARERFTEILAGRIAEMLKPPAKPEQSS